MLQVPAFRLTCVSAPTDSTTNRSKGMAGRRGSIDEAGWAFRVRTARALARVTGTRGNTSSARAVPPRAATSARVTREATAISPITLER